jgi:hypothetical protein
VRRFVEVAQGFLTDIGNIARDFLRNGVRAADFEFFYCGSK